MLIGSPGSGKSTVGEALARRLGADLLCTDTEIERRAGKPVGDIFIEDGEERFRALEREVVAEGLRAWEGVIAVGGGAVLDQDTRTDLADHHVVYLHVEFGEAAKRVGMDAARPLLSGNPRTQLRKLLNERLPVYEGLATVTVPTTGFHPEEIVDSILPTLTGQSTGRAQQ
ncbi:MULTISPECIES: shikimate kinase [Nocardiopsis]|uniref:Shikimate kinase n=1 Tax=Nocardiopsis tropica TaxID=109330 RepID=A0ABV1ZRD4_9ACTN|nr:shikimate kinase [Nocardiopsis umidischolae]MEE2046568.1 shikimate kinase [Nocardiopsis tropica]MEE2052626.1 shikimate kinase [Nocardiopsis umidischolae]